jgi:response regulator RpfG family c-di-GMP phosphodiesterase
MSGWGLWVLFGVVGWVALAIGATVVLARFFRVMETPPGRESETAPEHERVAAPSDGRWPESGVEEREDGDRRRILLVDDDPGIRLLLRTTLAADEFAVEEARSAEQAAGIARFWKPGFVILDVGLPGTDGLTFCRDLKGNPSYGAPIVVLLTGAETSKATADAAGADAVLRKPFSPLELVTLLDRLSESVGGLVFEPSAPDEEQLLIYARDLNRLFQVERTQRRLLQHAYRQTVTALADALEAKDPVTGLHALRVQRFAVELAGGLDPGLLHDPSLEYGFLLHDVGKIGIPDTILQKRGPLTDGERRVMERHTVIGGEMLADVALLQGEGLRVVRSHHERWDGQGYPDGLAGERIPPGARIFALVDALDAMTNERPYRDALDWEEATDEILSGSGGQFDPRVVAAFATREDRLRRISEELAEHAA